MRHPKMLIWHPYGRILNEIKDPYSNIPIDASFRGARITLPCPKANDGKSFVIKMSNSLASPNDVITFHGDIPVVTFEESKLKLWKDLVCNHDLKDYVGFSESYKYCTKCPHKESL